MLENNIFSDKGKKIHLVGIGGVSMSALAEALMAKGLSVTGSDSSVGVHTERLVSKGVEVFIGHDAKNVGNADALICTAAVKEDNPEICEARKRNIPVLGRAEAWGILMDEFSEVICISGTHGKTTTTAMTSRIAIEAGRNPEIMIGAHMPEIGGVVRIAQSELFIAEACEYCNSYHSFRPTVAAILNVEADHLDFFSGIEDIIKSFSKFCDNVRDGGVIVANFDDENAMKAVSSSKREVLTFGLETGADVTAKDLSYENGCPSFTLFCKGKELCRVSLSVIGEHNVKNALAAAACALSVGIDAEVISKALSGFTGVGRRMEYKGEFNGAKVYDDYAHHPSEISATLTAVRKSCKGRVICAFQPHTYTRTNALKEDFAKALSLADCVFLADIYAAREKNTIGITSAAISDLISGAEYVSGMEEISKKIASVAKEGDIVLTMGAGDIYKAGELLIKG